MQFSGRNQPWRAWYKLKRWQDLRIKVFLRDGFTCQCGCGHMEGNTSLLVADHIKPHRGSEAMFWNIENIQTLSKSCHDTKKQAEEQPSLHTRGVWY
jgi:5-methylcytosine-specific restriction protein A